MKIFSYRFFGVLLILWIHVGFFVCDAADFERYFDFRFSKPYLNENNEVEVTFMYSLEGFAEEDFKIRPVSDNAVVCIYDRKTGLWVSEYALWTSLPELNTAVKIKLDGLGEENAGQAVVGFLVQNTNNSKIYETDKKVIWKRGSGIEYVRKIDNNILFGSDRDGGESSESYNGFFTQSTESDGQNTYIPGQNLNDSEKPEKGGFPQISPKPEKGGFPQILLLKLFVVAVAVLVPVVSAFFCIKSKKFRFKDQIFSIQNKERASDKIQQWKI